MSDYRILLEDPRYAAKIEQLFTRSFGHSRLTKTVYRLREDLPPLADSSCMAVEPGGALLASLRFYPVLIEGQKALLLGPLAVEPALQGRGIGKALVRHGLTCAKRLGHGLCLVVGEPSYYASYGFRRASEEGLLLPGPVDPRRFQVLELTPGILGQVRGLVRRDERRRRKRPSAEAEWAASLLARSG
ncbi:MAG: N-acetyltransferase [Rhodospirillales bacterium]|nr:N-acetyltransferase [Rhodospirillales bacterium]